MRHDALVSARQLLQLVDSAKRALDDSWSVAHDVAGEYEVRDKDGNTGLFLTIDPGRRKAEGDDVDEFEVTVSVQGTFHKP